MLLLNLAVAKMVNIYEYDKASVISWMFFQYIVHYTLCVFKGETDAEGSEFMGCNWNGTDTVEGAKFRPPSVCGLPKERGSTPEGGNHTVRWYYDMEYGGCAR